jgi:urease accessory protein
MGVAITQRLQRVDATGRISTRRVDGRTRLERLYQDGASRIRLPTVDADPLEAILINMAGGLTGGDRIVWEAEVGEGSSLVLTTQACEKAYRSTGDMATSACRLVINEGARLSWLPQETILYSGCAFSRSIHVDMAPDANLLLVEASVFGRRAMGESMETASFADRWRVEVAGRMVHAEDIRFSGRVAETSRASAVLGSHCAMATILMVGPASEGKASAARDVFGAEISLSHWQVGGTGKLLARLTAPDSYELRKRLIPLIELLNGRAGLPKTWTI